MSYKLHVDNRNYDNFNVMFNDELVDCNDLKPFENKLFPNDVFTYIDNKVNIVYSSTRTCENIPAVLILCGNKTYGRENAKGRLLYKCVPDDIRIPIFMVPYEIKKLNFIKVLSNLYVTIHYKHWDNKHPVGNITQVIGDVNVLDNFYEYQLYCKSLNASIQKFNKDATQAVKANVHETFVQDICNRFVEIENRTHVKVFTIDSSSSIDYDDGFSIQNGIREGEFIISIYIANVTIWMEYLKLWNSFSQRISTIYLPDRKKPMLPSILCDCLCSLQENKDRFALTLDITIDSEYNIVSLNYKNTLINVFKNFTYESDELLTNVEYTKLFQVTKGLSQKYKHINTLRNSHDIVCYLMILMNRTCAAELMKYNNGIFRSSVGVPTVVNSQLPPDVQQMMNMWTTSCSCYVAITETGTPVIDTYVHITSPIRRLVDILNMIKLQMNIGLIVMSQEASHFYDTWLEKLDYINATMRSIKKVQMNCSLLDMCCNNPSTLEKTYDGYCFDKIIRENGLYQFMVYLPELKLTSKIHVRENMVELEKRQYKLFLLNDEDTFKRKIKLQLV